MPIYQGDCLDVMKTMKDNSIDFIITDPPYGLHFMGKTWDHGVPGMETWKETLRICKPGAWMAAFGGTRTYHRLTCAIEDAGWEIRDSILYWGYGQGFPKSHNFGCKCTRDPIQYSHEKISLSTSKEMPNLQSDISLSQQISDCEKSYMLNGMPSDTFTCSKEKTATGEAKINTNKMCGLPKDDMEKHLSLETDNQSNMFEDMQREREKQEFNQIQRQREGKEASRDGIEIGKESSLEGGNNLQEKQGELHRPEICSLPNRIHANGSQGRLCNGTSACNSETPQQDTSKSGSCSSQRPQHEEQFNRESGTISRQQDAQNSRMATCKNCGKLKEFKGYGTALKPAYEPIILAMKPIEGTYKQNAEKWGIAGLNIDDCRIEGSAWKAHDATGLAKTKFFSDGETPIIHKEPHLKGRWPANLILDEEAGRMLDEKSGITRSSNATRINKPSENKCMSGANTGHVSFGHNDSGGASRFFFCPKTSSKERNAGLDKPSSHPTVKPLALMRYIIKLLAPPGDPLLLDPFAGSGSTLIAAKELGIRFIGIEKEAEYCEIAAKRLASFKIHEQFEFNF